MNWENKVGQRKTFHDQPGKDKTCCTGVKRLSERVTPSQTKFCLLSQRQTRNTVLKSTVTFKFTFLSSSLLSRSFCLMCNNLNLSSLAIREGGMGSLWSISGLTCSHTSWNWGGFAEAAPLPLPPVVVPFPNSFTCRKKVPKLTKQPVTNSPSLHNWKLCADWQQSFSGRSFSSHWKQMQFTPLLLNH